MQGVFASRLQPDLPCRCLQDKPFPVLNAYSSGRCRMDLQEWLWDLAPQTRDVAVLHVTVLHQPEEGEHQRILLGRIGMAGRAPYRLLVDWQGGVAGPGKMWSIDLDLTGGSGEAMRLACGHIHLGILLVAGLASGPNAHWVLSQLLHSQP